MASQIAHVVYGRKVFDRLNTDLNWSEFVIGTTLPDARYITDISRDKAHYFSTSESKIPKDNSFEAGYYTHSFVDEKREGFIKSRGIYKHIPQDWIGVSALKLVEDELVYEKYKKWPQLIEIYDTLIEKEYDHIPNREAVKNWHNFLKDYFRVKPTKNIWYKAIVFITSDKKAAREVIQKTTQVKKNKQVMKIIRETYKNI